MEHFTLPPLVAKIANGEVTWQRLEGLDYETVGLFLTCHLIIEHYIDEYLKISYPDLDWDTARNSFAQKLSLLSRFKISDQYDCIPAIRHLNSIRNKLSHDIDFKITADNLLPLTQYLSKACGDKKEPMIPNESKGLLLMFTSLTCVIFASQISTKANYEAKGIFVRPKRHHSK